MYLHRSKEDRERIVRLSRENIQREKVAERLAKGPYFKKSCSCMCVIIIIILKRIDIIIYNIIILLISIHPK